MDNDLSYKSRVTPEHEKPYVRIAILELDIWDNYIRFWQNKHDLYYLPSGSLSLSTCLGEMAKRTSNYDEVNVETMVSYHLMFATRAPTIIATGFGINLAPDMPVLDISIET